MDEKAGCTSANASSSYSEVEVSATLFLTRGPCGPSLPNCTCLLQALKVFNGDVVHVGDDVLLSAEEDKPPYVSCRVDGLPSAFLFSLKLIPFFPFLLAPAKYGLGHIPHFKLTTSNQSDH